MAELKVFYDREGKTLTVWFTDRSQEYVCEETGDEVVLMKDRDGHVIGFEKLNFSVPIPTRCASRSRPRPPERAPSASSFLARICKTFGSRRLETASIGNHAGQPTPIFRGRLRSAFTASSLRGWRSQDRRGSNPLFRTSQQRSLIYRAFLSICPLVANDLLTNERIICGGGGRRAGERRRATGRSGRPSTPTRTCCRRWRKASCPPRC